MEADLPEHLELVLEWMDPVARHLRVDAASAVKRNSKAMVRACRRGDWELVEALYRSGFRVRSALSGAASDEEQKSKRGIFSSERSPRKVNLIPLRKRNYLEQYLVTKRVM